MLLHYLLHSSYKHVSLNRLCSFDVDCMEMFYAHFCIGAGAAPQSGAEAITQIATAVSGPLIFGDERDSVLAKWNQLQAFWGTGKGFYDQQGNTVAFGPDNPFCRFKV